MPKRKKKREPEDPFALVNAFANLVDNLFIRYSGKSIGGWLKDFQQQPPVLPPGESPPTGEVEMSLATAYALMGLPVDAPWEEVEKRYKSLAKVLHPDMTGGYKEAMAQLNVARDRIRKEKDKK